MKDLLIVVPYRNREEHLKGFLENSPTYFNKTGLTYDILICELDQHGDWNAGLSVNSLVNFVNSERSYSWLYIHHVDIWPIEGEWKFPQEREIFFNMGDYGSCLMRFEDFLKVDGYCNSFWGWGGEDNELYQKFREDGYRVTDYSQKNYAKYNVQFQNHPRNFNGKNYANAIKQSMLISRNERNNIKDFSEHAYTKDLTILQNNIYKHIVCPIRKSPSDTVNKNLLLTYVNTITNFDEIVSYTKSAQLHAAYEFDMAAIVIDKDPSSWLINQLQAFGVECIFDKSFVNNNYDKYYCYEKFLEKDSRYEFVMHTDIDNLFFQKNPFYSINKTKFTLIEEDQKITNRVFAAPKQMFVNFCRTMINYERSNTEELTALQNIFKQQMYQQENIVYKNEQDVFYVNLKNKNATTDYRKVYFINEKYTIVDSYQSKPQLKQTVDNHFKNYYYPL